MRPPFNIPRTNHGLHTKLILKNSANNGLMQLDTSLHFLHDYNPSAYRRTNSFKIFGLSRPWVVPDLHDLL